MENSFGVLEWGLDSAPEARKGSGALQLVIKKTNAFFVLVTCLDTVELQA